LRPLPVPTTRRRFYRQVHPSLPTSRFPDFANNASYDITAGTSSYNSLQTKYEHRFSQGLYLLAGYTWARTLSDAGDLIE